MDNALTNDQQEAGDNHHRQRNQGFPYKGAELHFGENCKNYEELKTFVSAAADWLTNFHLQAIRTETKPKEVDSSDKKSNPYHPGYNHFKAFHGSTGPPPPEEKLVVQQRQHDSNNQAVGVPKIAGRQNAQLQHKLQKNTQ